MCGRYTLVDPSPLLRRFGLTEFAETGLTPRFNMAPSQLIPIIVESKRGREMRLVRWGLVPPWMSLPLKSPPPINARVETLTEKPMFRGALRYQRCLIPADGFYEWKIDPISRRKQPMYIRLKGGSLFAFAGLYADPHPDHEAEGTCVIITTEANDLMAGIHTRMPVILEPDQESEWLNPREDRSAQVLRLLNAFSAAEMEAYPVSDGVSIVAMDAPELVERVSTIESPTLFPLD